MLQYTYQYVMSNRNARIILIYSQRCLILDPIESKSREWIIFIATTLIIGFAIGLVDVALGNIIRESSYLLLVGVGFIGIIAYLSFILMIPSIHITTDANCVLLYNLQKGEFLPPSVYMHYYLAQEAAEQSVRRSSIINNILKQDMKDQISNAELDAEILTHMLEYLVIRWLNRSDTTFFTFGSKTSILNYETFPCWLKNNQFIHTFHESKLNDVVDIHLREMIVKIPPEFKLISYLFPGNNVFIEGKQAKIAITYSIYSIWSVNYLNKQTHSIDGVSLNASYENKLQEELLDLRFVKARFSFDATIPRWRSILKRNEFIFFLHWCRELQNDFDNFFHVHPPNEGL